MTTLTVKVNDGHKYGDWQTGDGKYWRVCSVCKDQTEKNDIPTCSYQIPSTLCPQTDLVFTFTVPSGSALKDVGYDTGMRGSNVSASNLHQNQDGSYTVTLPWSDFNEEGHVSLQIFAVTSDGYTFITNLGEVTVLSEHPWGAWVSNHDDTHSHTCAKDSTHSETKSCNGGKATCLTRATCTDCGEPYGDLNPQNHVKGTDWVRTETTHESKYLCCGEIVVEEEPHEWNNGKCSECGYGCPHKGGSATCTEKAVCDICGQTYGELASDAHTQQAVWTITAETHEKTYPCCNAVAVEEEPHEWKNGVCTECGYECLHSGGEATCAEKATCATCGEKYGDLKPHSYSTEWSADETSHWHECTECGAKTDEAKHADTDKDHKCDICKAVMSQCADTDKDHKCDLCGKTLSEHSGGTATCKDKAICEICGESYGELDGNNHADMKHIEAKAATKTSEGNIEYWYCSGCGKYYKDAAATQEITKAQTVTAKLPSDNNGSAGGNTGNNNKSGNDATTSPQTGENSSLAFWITLLFVGGGAVTVTTVYGIKKRRSTK